ncbi:hypothetical protein J3R30DRAFT_3409802 [Lentinula aciculospora]|uniref:Uncharacterized protein n=1 Tax=Lentinula aciculospora TaxID=153920 RepID=A0A9W8ZWC2_9AGAR|nr:hypothetical protein J3R30DRAFT_3409802 [Lentinula aciculospora]
MSSLQASWISTLADGKAILLRGRSSDDGWACGEFESKNTLIRLKAFFSAESYVVIFIERHFAANILRYLQEKVYYSTCQRSITFDGSKIRKGLRIIPCTPIAHQALPNHLVWAQNFVNQKYVEGLRALRSDMEKVTLASPEYLSTGADQPRAIIKKRLRLIYASAEIAVKKDSVRVGKERKHSSSIVPVDRSDSSRHQGSSTKYEKNNLHCVDSGVGKFGFTRRQSTMDDLWISKIIAADRLDG